MDEPNDYEELNIEEVIQKPVIRQYKASKGQKSLGTLSTYSCTFEFDRLLNFPTQKKNKSDSYSKSKSSKSLRKSFSELPERLSWLKQVAENKVKFLQVEKELKELEGCTFTPKTNIKDAGKTVSHFAKQQEKYKKSRNSTIARLKVQYGSRSEPVLKVQPLKTVKSGTISVYERLYNESRVFSKTTKLKKLIK